MLSSLHVHNFALIEDALIEFKPGFNVFTGETGAGKSIIIDAFGIVLGTRASNSYIRSGEESYWVQAVFDIAEQAGVQKLLEEMGIDNQEDTLILRRRVNARGKSQSFVNGVQVPLTQLGQLAAELVDIHGQHENQQLLRTGAALTLTDLYGGAPVAEALEYYKGIFVAQRKAADNLQALLSQKEARESLTESLDAEIREIEGLSPRIGEEEELRSEINRFQNGEKLLQAISDAHLLLEGDGGKLPGALDAVDEAKRVLQKVERFDVLAASWNASLETAWLSLEDVRQSLGEYLSSQTFDSNRLDALQSRLDGLYRLKKKYGGSLEAVLERLNENKARRDALESLDKSLREASALAEGLAQKLFKAADRLTELRTAAGKTFGGLITEHMQDLAMEAGHFEVLITSRKEYGINGKDEADFLFTANAGIEPRPLQKIASGGELSRLALAIKTVLLKNSGASTMVFDEIDTGIGGVTAQKMAEKIAVIAQERQVLCVTHLPQIASFADNHLLIVKQQKDSMTTTSVMPIVGAERAEEIRRMVSGDNNTAIALANAQELLILAEKIKGRLKLL